MKTILHIGYHKTASTYLQKYVFPEMKLNYITSFLKSSELINKMSNSDLSVTEILPEILNKKLIYDITLISHEQLSGLTDGKNINIQYIIANNIKKIFPDAKILIVVRNQFDYLKSIYAYRVTLKGYETRTFNTFMEDALNNGFVEKLKYSNLISYYAEKYGTSNVFVIPMELLKTDKDKFINSISKFIGVKKPNIKEYKKENQSIKSVYVISFWLPLNFLFKIFIKILTITFKPKNEFPFIKIRFGYYKIKRFINLKMNLIFKKSKKIDVKKHNKYQIFYNIFCDENKILQKYTQFNLKKLGYPTT